MPWFTERYMVLPLLGLFIRNSIFELYVRTLYSRDLTFSWLHTLSKYNTFQSWPCW